VLDEGHIIRNESTQTAKAAYALKSKYRWIMSGTPINNRFDQPPPPCTLVQHNKLKRVLHNLQLGRHVLAASVLACTRMYGQGVVEAEH
jgi:hypothetical protein